MKILNPSSTDEIKSLKKDDVVFPEIDYTSNEDLNLKSTTLLSAYTTISRRVDKKFIEDLQWDQTGDIAWQNYILKYLSDKISTMIDDYKSSPSDFLLEKIFIWIQLWGGNSGRGIFVQGEKWPNNFKVEAYKNAVEKIHQKKYVRSLDILNSLYGISTAFATKHIHFWSKGAVPIYDSIIAAILFGRNQHQVRAKEYPLYIEALNQMCKKLAKDNINVSSIERNLFNWANTEDGVEWRESRLNKTE